MTPSIKVEGLSKQYEIGARPAGYRTVREALTEALAAPLRRRARASIWALEDVSFEVHPGETVGVIGRNGSGKSTLLKILSRITEPTGGRARIHGRLGSLLEVGTGFHPELTGRENIHMCGTILGMSRREVARKFDEIVAFAEIGPFLDTPVKRYSSGMYVRLAFAVAAHLESEILIVDEVLAVGDLAFQNKCLERMRQVGRGGRIVLFVSHNIATLQTLCDRALLLEGGRLDRDGPIHEISKLYYDRIMIQQNGGGASPFDRERPHGWRKIFRHATLLDEAGRPTSCLPLGASFRLRIGLDAPEPIVNPTLLVGVDDTLGQRLLTVRNPASGGGIRRLTGRCEVECRIPVFPLAPGDYWIKLAINEGGCWLDGLEQAFFFTVGDGAVFDEGRPHLYGPCIAPSEWTPASAAGSTRGVDARPVSSDWRPEAIGPVPGT
jgi:lipopolysaccharide transport system ATP-binding protein